MSGSDEARVAPHVMGATTRAAQLSQRRTATHQVLTLAHMVMQCLPARVDSASIIREQTAPSITLIKRAGR